MPNTALKIDQVYTSRFTTGLPQSSYYRTDGPTVIELHRRKRHIVRDLRGLILDENEATPRKARRRRRRKLTLRSILQGGLEVGAFGTILATFMGSLWVLAQ
jgi:hypothetical protein